jgi:hypothetical protein
MIAKQILRAVHKVGFTAGISIICVAFYLTTKKAISCFFAKKGDGMAQIG